MQDWAQGAHRLETTSEKVSAAPLGSSEDKMAFQRGHWLGQRLPGLQTLNFHEYTLIIFRFYKFTL